MAEPRRAYPRMGRPLSAAWGLVLWGLPGMAMAQTLAVSPACTRQCNAGSGAVRANPPEVQACLIRCNAGQNFDRNAGRAAAPPAHAAPAIQARSGPLPAGPAPVRSQSAASAPNAPARPNDYAALQGPTGQRLAAGPRDSYAPHVRGLTAAMVARPSGGQGRAGAIYLAAPPNAAYGLTFGMADRLGAHGQAERNCQSRGAGTCRLSLEFTERCGAVAQAHRSNGLFRTADPSTYTVTFAAGGAGASKDSAEAQALADCRSRDRSAVCEVVASGCGG